MKVAVLGASGSTGALVVDALIKRSHDIVAVSRSPVRRRGPVGRFTAKEGDLTNAAFLRSAIADCDAVISCLGQTRSSKSLFARRVSPPDILRTVAAATVQAIGDDRQRLVYMSAFGVGEDRKRHALLFRIILRLSSIHDAYLDHDAAEQIIRSSSVAWTIVRPPGLTDTDEDVQLVDKSDKWSSFENATKRSVARFMVECLDQPWTLGKTMTIGKPQQLKGQLKQRSF